jgi:hypothetical protein
MSFCVKCGKELPANAAFCGHCGTAVGGGANAGYSAASSAPKSNPVTPVVPAASSAATTTAVKAAAGGSKVKGIVIALIVFAVAFFVADGFSSGSFNPLSSTGSGTGTANDELAAIETIMNRDMNAMITSSDLPSACADLTIDIFEELPSDVQSVTKSATGLSDSELKTQIANRYETLGYDSSAQATLSAYGSVDIALSLGTELSDAEILSMESVLSDAGIECDIDRGYEIDGVITYENGSTNSQSLDIYIVKIDNKWYLMFDSDTLESMLVDGAIESNLI